MECDSVAGDRMVSEAPGVVEIVKAGHELGS
jgi:hypothetical protein